MLIEQKLEDRGLDLHGLSLARWMDRQMQLEDIGLEEENLERGLDILADIAKEQDGVIKALRLNVAKLKTISEEASKGVEVIKNIISDTEKSDVMKIHDICTIIAVTKMEMGIID